MQGMRFLMLNEKGDPLNHGVIAQRISEDKYLCSFARQPASSRLCHTDEIMSWNLFPSDDAMNAFITNIQAQKTPVDSGLGKKTPVKKKAKKKATKKASTKKVARKENGR